MSQRKGTTSRSKNPLRNIGKRVWIIDTGKIVKTMVYGTMVKDFLNTGSDIHGKLLDTEIRYQVENRDGKKEYIDQSKVYFSESEIMNLLK